MMEGGANPMGESISRAEHEEFARRIDEQEKRQDRRIELLEKNVQEIGALTISVHELATSVAQMAKEQERQGERLEGLEGRDGAKWRKFVGYVASALVGGIIGFLMIQMGISG